MNILIDIGNTACKFAIESQDEINLIFILSTKDFLSSSTLLEEKKSYLPESIDDVYVSSVVPSINEKIVDFFRDIYEKTPIFISPLDDSGVAIEIDDKNELGTDLLCDLAGANHEFGYPTLIIDLGTATKFLFIDKEGKFKTCAFVPGLELSLHTLANNTALLPNLGFDNVKGFLDLHNTADVLTSSAYYSHVDTINGFVSRYQKEIGYPFHIVMTGGNIELVKKGLNFKFNLVNNLCLKGIKVIKDRKAI